jgi:hypothetical protein
MFFPLRLGAIVNAEKAKQPRIVSVRIGPRLLWLCYAGPEHRPVVAAIGKTASGAYDAFVLALWNAVQDDAA